MAKEKTKPNNCMLGGCSEGYCRQCGFNRFEDARRKKIPLTLCEDGLWRKILQRKPEATNEVQGKNRGS